MREDHEVFGHEFRGAPLPPEPVLSNFYTPTDEQRVGIHSIEHGWNQRSFVLAQELNYITSCNIIICSKGWGCCATPGQKDITELED